MKMLRIEMLPVAEGDALWIEYGHPNAPRRILVDGGPARTYHALRSRILALPPASRRFELVVATHIDTDHIDGIIRLLRDESLGVSIGDIWFNGYPQLIEADTQGPDEGEFLGALIQQRELPWNHAFDRRAVMVRDAFDPVPLADGMRATVLGPTRAELQALLQDWESVLQDEDWVPGDAARALAELDERSRLDVPPPVPAPPDVLGDEFQPDTSKANASSIAFLLEDGDGRRLLLTGDTHSAVLVPQLEALGDGERVKVDAFKLPHHGSRRNVSREMLAAVDPGRYLISSSGAKFQHPDRATVERILERHAGESRPPRLSFNYRSPYNEMWADPRLQEERHYSASFPEGLVVEL
jgi:glyoxylase-like metal-dependent hydrolase (beta-lactamase superfamily II)